MVTTTTIKRSRSISAQVFRFVWMRKFVSRKVTGIVNKTKPSIPTEGSNSNKIEEANTINSTLK